MVDVRLANPSADGPAVSAPATATLTTDGSADAVRRAAGRTARGLGGSDGSDGSGAVVDAGGLSGDRLAAAVEGLVLGCYRFGSPRKPKPAPTRITLTGTDDAAALARGLRSARATAWSRDLANTRSDVKSPQWIGAQARSMLEPLGVAVTVRDEDWLRAQGFGGVLAVGAGSPKPSCLVEAVWRPRGVPAAPHLVIVGKGITFDTGGLDRKSGDGMTTMYTDMAGGAAVLGALHAVAAARLPMRVTALVPSAENAFGGASYRPGDVVRHVGGRTSEIRNTDAEGRLVLADAIAYAATRLRPTAIVDVATLTGAMKVALGLHVGGLLATSDELAAALRAAGDQAGEPLWRLPLHGDYTAALDSDVADVNNSPGSPGGITAALFLRPFAGDVPWAHLDIAGPARAGTDDGMIARGATGFGASLLRAWVESHVPSTDA